MARRVALALLTLVLFPLAVTRVAHAQNADAGAPIPSATTRPSLVPDASASTTSPPPITTSTSIPAATMPTPQVKPAAKADDTKQSGPRASDDVPAAPNEIFSEDWWGRTRPVLEIHGYFRTRAELLHNFTLGRHENPNSTNSALFPQPIDNSYSDTGLNPQNLNLCDATGAISGTAACKDQTQSGANMRFRINPELHISDNLRIMAQIDAFDNMVLGSTPDSYALAPSGSVGNNPLGYRSAGYNTFAPIGIFTTTQGPPTTGINSLSNSVNFQRAWGEYMTPLGQLRFGRMPSQWGLGILSNAGDNIDADYQTNVDRIMFVTGIKSLDLYFAGMWDFVNSGPTNASPYDVYGGQPVNTCNLCNVNEWGLVVAHRTNPELQKLKLARGDMVVNGGLFTILRSQYLDLKDPNTPLSINQDPTTSGGLSNTTLVRRNAWAVIPDLWLQILYKKFRLEAEGVAILGEIGAIPGGAYNATRQTDVRMWGMAAQTEFRALEDKLHLQFDFGYASGDQWAQNPLGSNGLNPELNGNAISTFSFHPAYTVDLIFFRRILSRIEGAYYFRPEVDYDFIRNSNGQRFGGGAALIWSRASEFIQTPGHQPDLGVELDLQLYYQAKDGSLNDDPSKIGGFFTMLQYGVFFPLGGLGYLPSETLTTPPVGGWDLSAAQTVRWFVGVVY
jgi:uncharacterized protein (TIGR04551 family)